MKERKLTEKESLEVITSMISRTKERYMMGDGNIMLMWGYLILTVTALIWILIATTHNQQWNWLWFAIWIGGIITPIMSRKKQIKSGVKSYSDKIMSRIWSTVGFSGLATTLMCLGFLLILGLAQVHEHRDKGSLSIGGQKGQHLILNGLHARFQSFLDAHIDVSAFSFLRSACCRTLLRTVWIYLFFRAS